MNLNFYALSRVLWKQDVLNWPEGQMLNLSCLVQKRYKKETDGEPENLYNEDIFNLNWNMPNNTPTNFEVNPISPEHIVFHPGLHSHSDLWKTEYIQGIQLIVFDPVTTGNSGDYLCKGVPYKNDDLNTENDTLVAQTHITVHSGKSCF